MKEVKYLFKFETETQNLKSEGFTEYDEAKWNTINEICKSRKASIFGLIEDYLETLTPEKAEEIITSWDM